MVDMSKADISVTGFTTIPLSDRVARPTGRRVGRSLIERTLDSYRFNRRHRRAWKAQVTAERAAAPSFLHPRDTFTLRHSTDEVRRI